MKTQLTPLLWVALTATATAQLPDSLPPFPALPEAASVGSVPMGDSRAFSEVQLDIDITDGPFRPTWASIEENYPGTPAWLREAKFGIWVHFGPQAAGESGDWYARNLYKQGHTAYQNHLRRYGHPSQVGYKEVLRDWNPSQLDPERLTELYSKAGARFLMIQGVHHDNFDLWNSRYQPWNSVNIGPHRDLLREWADACRRHGMFYGVTFHHEYTWWWWQTAFGCDSVGEFAGVTYDGHLTAADGAGQWWEGYDPRLLYGVDLREYATVAEKAASPWSPPASGIFGRHTEYARWYATQWALRMMDVVANYDPDFIYTDGTVQGPFTGEGTGTGFRCNAMPTVMADYYNRTLKQRGEVNTFSIVKFRKPTNGTVNTAEFDFPDTINASQAWIREAPVGDWFYAPGFTYDAGMMIRFIIEAIARDGNAAINICFRPDGSLDEACEAMLLDVGRWMEVNGEAVYGSRAWLKLGDGEVVDGKLRTLPGGSLRRKHADFAFSTHDFRFTVGKNGALYAFCMTVPQGGEKLVITSLAKNGASLSQGANGSNGGAPQPQRIKRVSLLGYNHRLKWRQTAAGLEITYPTDFTAQTAVTFCVISQ
jgi:alpha-L-fucosidase